MASLGIFGENKVDKVEGKGLSTNDFTNELKTLLETKKVKDVDSDVDGNIIVTYTDDTTSEIAIEGGTGSSGSYTNSTPVPVTLGGVTSGTTFLDVPVNDVITTLLYPYQNPAFTSFGISGLSVLSYEVGYTYPAGTKTFTWATSNSSNVKPSSISLNGVGGLSNDGTEDAIVADITKVVPSTHVFNISGLNTKDQAFSRTLTLTWQYKRYWGAEPLTELDDTELLALNSELSASRVKTVTYDCTGGKYFYIAYPASFGDMNNTKINSLSWNDWILVKRDVVNSQGVAVPMNIYRSFNLLNGTITVNWG